MYIDKNIDISLEYIAPPRDANNLINTPNPTQPNPQPNQPNLTNPTPSRAPACARVGMPVVHVQISVNLLLGWLPLGITLLGP
jgi:hypothetical protein